ncbi:unnamed protein product [Caenorhabditis auriculariae]|uniref:Uncharacterized protein n=1 Tax=Caenorhabditis auriculariae TaxID=2777116 RepID=A0A8S1HTS7_9PELO|nr:unnamed protein product [Caenorhabditis auriculariae]
MTLLQNVLISLFFFNLSEQLQSDKCCQIALGSGSEREKKTFEAMCRTLSCTKGEVQINEETVRYNRTWTNQISKSGPIEFDHVDVHIKKMLSLVEVIYLTKITEAPHAVKFVNSTVSEEEFKNLKSIEILGDFLEDYCDGRKLVEIDKLSDVPMKVQDRLNGAVDKLTEPCADLKKVTPGYKKLSSQIHLMSSLLALLPTFYL